MKSNDFEHKKATSITQTVYIPLANKTNGGTKKHWANCVCASTRTARQI